MRGKKKKKGVWAKAKKKKGNLAKKWNFEEKKGSLEGGKRKIRGGKKEPGVGGRNSEPPKKLEFWGKKSGGLGLNGGGTIELRNNGGGPVLRGGQSGPTGSDHRGGSGQSGPSGSDRRVKAVIDSADRKSPPR